MSFEYIAVKIFSLKHENCHYLSTMMSSFEKIGWKDINENFVVIFSDIKKNTFKKWQDWE